MPAEVAIPSLNVALGKLSQGRVVAKIWMDKTFAAEVTQKLKPYKALPEGFRPGMEEVADYVRDVMIRRTFQQEGPGWQPLAERTQREREFFGYPPRHPILIRSGDLMAELTEKSHPRHVEVIKTGKNARIEVGGSSAKFVQNQMGDESLNLPARSMIPGLGRTRVQRQDAVEIQRILRSSMMDLGIRRRSR